MTTGFPSPAQGYEEKTIDLNSLLVKHPAATIFMRIDTSRYTRMGIFCGDLIVVDRALAFKKESLVVFENSEEGAFNLARISDFQENNGEINICGVVSYVIHKVRW